MVSSHVSTQSLKHVLKGFFRYETKPRRTQRPTMQLHTNLSHEKRETPWKRNKSVIHALVVGKLQAKPKHLTRCKKALSEKKKTTELQKGGYFADDEKVDLAITLCVCGRGATQKNLIVDEERNAHAIPQESYVKRRTSTQLEGIPQKLRGPSYGSSLDQELYGKATKHRKKAVLKGSTTTCHPN